MPSPSHPLPQCISSVPPLLHERALSPVCCARVSACMSAAPTDTLQQWVKETRELSARRLLADAGLPARLAASLPQLLLAYAKHATDALGRELLLLLRVLRNLCVGVSVSQDQLYEAGTAAHLAQLCRHLAQQDESKQRGELLEAALQALGNACVQHERNQDAAWYAPLHAVVLGRITQLQRAQVSVLPGHVRIGGARQRCVTQRCIKRVADAPLSCQAQMRLPRTRRCAWCYTRVRSTDTSGGSPWCTPQPRCLSSAACLLQQPRRAATKP